MTFRALRIKKIMLQGWINEETSSCKEKLWIKQGKRKKIDPFDEDVIKRELLQMLREQEFVTLQMNAENYQYRK